MPKLTRRKSFAERGWVKLALLVLAGLLLVILGRREDEQKEDSDPVIWRRDIEMGPTDADKPRQAAPDVPDARAGVGLAVEREELSGMAADVAAPTGTGASQDSQRAPVEGPIPLPEDEDNDVEMQTPAGDDLAIVEGIGPKINSVLHEAGIRTFAQLAEATPERLGEILREAGLRLANPESWAEQARLAAEGEWSKLDTFQKKLKGGRKG
jgi:predicted flap endonuclease-1-like 5' DNA nuclease